MINSISNRRHNKKTISDNERCHHLIFFTHFQLTMVAFHIWLIEHFEVSDRRPNITRINAILQNTILLHSFLTFLLNILQNQLRSFMDSDCKFPSNPFVRMVISSEMSLSPLELTFCNFRS